MTEEELLAFKEEIKQELKSEIKLSKKDKKKKGKGKDKDLDGEEVEEHGLYYTKSEPRKSFSTFMRNQNKFYVNSLNIIDRKASIMIRVNSTIISAIVLFFEYVQDIKFGTLIGIVMVLASFISMISAINASKPYSFSMYKFYQEKVQRKHPEMEKNLFVIGMYPKVSLEEYEAAYGALVNSQELQIGNQVRAMYTFEKQVHRAFAQIDIAYGAFMIGFLIVILVFLFGVISGLV
ncbi:MAG: hypothetical protein AAF242_11670 [Bacteroidota bacterium]